MGVASTRPLTLSDPAFLRRLRAIASDSGRVIVTRHAKQRMRERGINLRQIMDCLRRGRIVESAHVTIHGDWKATLEHQSAGDRVRVAAGIERQEDGDVAVVVTVMG
jgi:tRNA(His) 5'-end guanylyltransferase